ncbi:hypothetical protein BGW36DRAFT_89419 [Talaromyces proteolyticus]|uniref:Nucleoside phosphorylase domain-containing protein n=1 Tax=Talaromyces proteolyticus TaxID=1131652 RepID=A0AAD4Q4Z7_9EURO|nr:uncharacterized protein BGW36DRAFT_89419 [Talaromyces proteolyticus]KAH8703639.1 hypothetical protein BGW36DRAFT_89419 [Talaromyces proteolyticus]
MPPTSRDEIDVAIICALPLEVDAVDALFDECYDNLEETDENELRNYNISTVGRIGRHYVALVQLPGIGKSSAAGVTSTLLLNFTAIRLVLLVGICGGVPFPSKGTEMLLGDIVIGDSVVEYDFGRRYPAGFERKGGEKCNNDRNLKSFIANLKTKKIRNKLQDDISSHLSYLHSVESDWAYPGSSQDILFEASYKHSHRKAGGDILSPCTLCDSDEQSSVCQDASVADCDQLGCDGELVQRNRLKERGTAPFIHFGKIASADTVMKSGEDRDRLAHDEGIIALEMEAAAVWDNLDGIPCLVVKGVSDYADSHKSKQWQNYAAATAASCAKALLESWRPGLKRGLRKHLSAVDKNNDILPVIFSVPVLRNHRFSGREYQLKQLEEMASLRSYTLENNYSYPITAVYGLGGIGKTQLASEFVFRCNRKDSKTSILWVSAASLDAINTDFISIGIKLKKLLIEDENQKKSHTQRSTLLTLSGVELVKEWMSIPGNNWILVLDNYDDISVNVQQFLPEHLPDHKLSGMVIITTRDKRVVGPIATSGFELPQMGFDTSIQLFLRLLQGDATHECEDYWTHPEHETVQRIVQELHGFPLAIDQAAAFIRENSPTFSEYLRYLMQASDRELLFRFKQVNPTYPESIMTTWEISFNYLAKKHPRASELLQILGFFHHSRISEKLLLNAMVERQWEFTFLPQSLSLESNRLPEMRCLTPNAGFRVAVGVLCAFSLVKRGFTEHELTIHPLVHEWIRLRLNGNRAMQARMSLCAALAVYQTFPFELVFDNMNGSRSEALGNALCNIGLISPHTEHIALNLQEYSDEEPSRPECIALFLSLPLIRRAHPSAFRSFMSKRAFHKVNDWLPSYLSRAPTQYHPVFSLIWTINKWNEQEHDSDIWSQRATTILRVLKASREKLKAPPMIMLILVQVLVGFFRFKSSWGKQTIAKMSSSDTLEIGSSQANITLSSVSEETRNCTVQLIHSFRHTLDFETDDPVFKDAITLYAEMRCVSYLSITEFWEQAHGPLIDDPLSMNLTHLSQKDRSLLVSVVCMLQWEKYKLRNFEDVRRVYEFGIAQATNRATLISKGLRQQAKQVWVPISNYISNSWGRNGSEFMAAASKSAEMDDIISPYLERTALGVIESISDPQSYWISATGPKSEPHQMKLEERRYAITLFKLWKTCLAELHSMKILVYNSQSVRAGLMRVSLNLNEWDTVLRVVDGMFQLDTLDSKYGKGGRAGAKRLWEPRTTHTEESSSVWADSNRMEDSWIKNIVIRSLELSNRNAVERYLLSLNQKGQGNTYQHDTEVVAKSESFAVYILGQYPVTNAIDTLLSPFTDEALEAMTIALHKSGRMKSTTYHDTMTRLEYIMLHSSVLVRCLGRLALLVSLSYFPRPASSMDIKGNTAIPDER